MQPFIALPWAGHLRVNDYRAPAAQVKTLYIWGKHQLSIYRWILFGFIFFRNDHFTKFVPSLYQLQTVWTLCRIYFVSLNHIGPTLAQRNTSKRTVDIILAGASASMWLWGGQKTWTFFRKGVLKHVFDLILTISTRLFPININITKNPISLIFAVILRINFRPSLCDLLPFFFGILTLFDTSNTNEI